MFSLRTTLLASALLASAGSAYADTIVITPERETVIREYVGRNHVDSVVTPDGYALDVGTRIPSDVTLVPVDVPEYSYDYVVIDGRTAIVDRDTREVIRILD